MKPSRSSVIVRLEDERLGRLRDDLAARAGPSVRDEHRELPVIGSHAREEQVAGREPLARTRSVGARPCASRSARRSRSGTSDQPQLLLRDPSADARVDDPLDHLGGVQPVDDRHLVDAAVVDAEARDALRVGRPLRAEDAPPLLLACRRVVSRTSSSESTSRTYRLSSSMPANHAAVGRQHLVDVREPVHEPLAQEARLTALLQPRARSNGSTATTHASKRCVAPSSSVHQKDVPSSSQCGSTSASFTSDATSRKTRNGSDGSGVRLVTLDAVRLLGDARVRACAEVQVARPPVHEVVEHRRRRRGVGPSGPDDRNVVASTGVRSAGCTGFGSHRRQRPRHRHRPHELAVLSARARSRCRAAYTCPAYGVRSISSGVSGSFGIAGIVMPASSFISSP